MWSWVLMVSIPRCASPWGLKRRLASRPYFRSWRGTTGIVFRERNPGTEGCNRTGIFLSPTVTANGFAHLRSARVDIDWYAIANTSTLSGRSAAQVPFGRWSEARHSPIPELLAEAVSIIGTRVQDRLSALPATKGRIATLGDAAHPISPNFGQGACLALEDAVVLAACLKSDPLITNALRRYERSRHRRCREVLLTSRETGRLGQIQNRALVHVRKHFFKLAPSAFTTFWFRRSCDFHPPSLSAS